MKYILINQTAALILPYYKCLEVSSCPDEEKERDAAYQMRFDCDCRVKKERCRKAHDEQIKSGVHACNAIRDHYACLNLWPCWEFFRDRISDERKLNQCECFFAKERCYKIRAEQLASGVTGCNASLHYYNCLEVSSCPDEQKERDAADQNRLDCECYVEKKRCYDIRAKQLASGVSWCNANLPYYNCLEDTSCPDKQKERGAANQTRLVCECFREKEQCLYNLKRGKREGLIDCELLPDYQYCLDSSSCPEDQKELDLEESLKKHCDCWIEKKNCDDKRQNQLESGVSACMTNLTYYDCLETSSCPEEQKERDSADQERQNCGRKRCFLEKDRCYDIRAKQLASGVSWCNASLPYYNCLEVSSCPDKQKERDAAEQNRLDCECSQQKEMCLKNLDREKEESVIDCGDLQKYQDCLDASICPEQQKEIDFKDNLTKKCGRKSTI
ncbi:hypothetical protein RRG08_015417 [Elysia crispata]|uniref:Uncharacterized protein n=1 Tax=Elysia crispata TaxID=231223 RepID=A0AAE0ZXX5_9GAST|nr:hypothetical protein RRG08_015417 [Elysia crispata]